MATVTIEVTQADINEGRPEPCHCPIALAIRRHFGNTTWVSVGDEFIDLGNVEVETPEIARLFIYGFDGQHDVSPFKFDLDIPGDLLTVA